LPAGPMNQAFGVKIGNVTNIAALELNFKKIV
jgi:hypothetical protein